MMVKQLIKTEWTIQSTRLAVYIVLCAAVYGLLCFAIGGATLSLTTVGFLTVYFYVMQTFSQENGQVLLLAAPYTRDDFVKAKFTAVFLYLGALYLLTAIIAIVLSCLGIMQFADWASGLVMSLLVCSITCAVTIPIFYKFGYMAGKNLQLIAMAALVIITLTMANAGMDTRMNAGVAFNATGACVSVIAVFLSYKLCLGLMRKKQF